MKSRMSVSVLLGVGLALAGIACASRGNSGCGFGDLAALADAYGTDKGTMEHCFAEVYDHYFAPMRYKATRVCEIGVSAGASIKMFRDYFPNAVIYGIDIEDTSHLNSKTIKTFVADQASREQLKRFIDASGGDFDLLLDDGGHSMEQQQVSFGYLFPSVKPGGYYVIEDLHTSLDHQKSKFGVAKSEVNTTLAMIDRYIRTGKIESRYMTAEEQGYLTDHLVYCSLYSRNNGGSITCIFKKK